MVRIEKTLLIASCKKVIVVQLYNNDVFEMVANKLYQWLSVLAVNTQRHKLQLIDGQQLFILIINL